MRTDCRVVALCGVFLHVAYFHVYETWIVATCALFIVQCTAWHLYTFAFCSAFNTACMMGVSEHLDVSKRSVSASFVFEEDLVLRCCYLVLRASWLWQCAR